MGKTNVIVLLDTGYQVTKALISKPYDHLHSCLEGFRIHIAGPSGLFVLKKITRLGVQGK